jgi:DNA-binding GntR family transcriptional regulator
MAEARLKKAKRRTLGESVTDLLREAVFDGRLSQGARISQLAVASEISVSQGPVREALAKLEAEGLVERRSNGGSYVITLNRQDVEEILSLRTTLEMMALRLLIKNITPEQIAELEKNIHRSEHVSGDNLARLDIEFHRKLMQFTGHKRLLTCWSTLVPQLQLVMRRFNVSHPNAWSTTAEHHRSLLRAIGKRDESAALALLARQNDCHHRINEQLAGS